MIGGKMRSQFLTHQWVITSVETKPVSTIMMFSCSFSSGVINHGTSDINFSLSKGDFPPVMLAPLGYIAAVMFASL